MSRELFLGLIDTDAPIADASDVTRYRTKLTPYRTGLAQLRPVAEASIVGLGGSLILE